MASFTQWQSPSGSYPAGDAPFRAAEVAGPQPFFHDPLDAARAMHRRTPDAQYPDGYVGTVQTRRQDRLREGLRERSDNKPYSRGVHKGERLDGRDYFWPAEMQPTDGLLAQSLGKRYVPPGILMEAGMAPMKQGAKVPMTGDLARVGIKGTPGRTGTVEWDQHNPDRAAQLRHMAPPWSGPGMGVGMAYPGR